MLAAQQVVLDLAARLQAMPATGGRVFTSPARVLQEADLPCWRITYISEDVVDAGVAGANLCQLELGASVYARDTLDLDTQLAALMAEGQALLFAPTRPFALQRGSMTPDVVEVAEASAGRLTLALRASYVVDPAQPETLLSS